MSIFCREIFQKSIGSPGAANIDRRGSRDDIDVTFKTSGVSKWVPGEIYITWNFDLIWFIKKNKEFSSRKIVQINVWRQKSSYFRLCLCLNRCRENNDAIDDVETVVSNAGIAVWSVETFLRRYGIRRSGTWCYRVSTGNSTKSCRRLWSRESLLRSKWSISRARTRGLSAGLPRTSCGRAWRRVTSGFLCFCRFSAFVLERFFCGPMNFFTSSVILCLHLTECRPDGFARR